MTKQKKQLGPWRRLLLGELPLETETAQFVLVNVIDFFMTYLLLTSGVARESNPVAAYFLHRWGMIRGMLYFKLSLVVFVCLLAQVIATQSVTKAQWLLRFGTVVVAGVVIYSLTLYLRHT